MPRPTRISGPSGSTATRAICSPCKTRSRAGSRIALNLELIGAEAARPTEHPDALDYILRGRAASLKPRTRDNYAEAISLFERALALDPQSVEAQSRLASALAARVMSGMTDSAAADIARAEGLVGQALAASPRSASAHFAKGQVLRAQHRWEEAIPEYETVLAFNRNLVSALHALGRCKLCAGSIEEAIPLVEQAIRLSPRDPLIGVCYSGLGSCICCNRAPTRRSSGSKRRAAPCLPHPVVRSRLASAYALKGETERAAAELAEARRLGGDDRFSSIARLKAVGIFGGAEDPRLVRSHLFRRPAQGRNAGGITPSARRRGLRKYRAEQVVRYNCIEQ